MKHNCNPQVIIISLYSLLTHGGMRQGAKSCPQTAHSNKKGLEQEVQDLVVGVAGFELATSASLRRRSNQAEPHPVFQTA